MKHITLLSVILSVLVCGCRSDKAPPMGILCTLNGTGAGNCVKADKTRVLLLPSQMVNFFATDQASMAAFSGFCYSVPASTANVELMKIQKDLKAPSKLPLQSFLLDGSKDPDPALAQKP